MLKFKTVPSKSGGENNRQTNLVEDFVMVPVKSVPHEKPAAKPAGNKSPKNVLIVDDDRHVAEFVADALSDKLGIKAVIVDSALAARIIIAGPEGPFDLVITDMNMGKGMTGLELIRWLEQESPATHAILMSANEISESHVVTFQKPINCETLIAIVRAELEL